MRADVTQRAGLSPRIITRIFPPYHLSLHNDILLCDPCGLCERLITSDKWYENRAWLWGYRENDPMDGYDPYSASKGCSELVTSAYRNPFFNLAEYDRKHYTLLASARAGNVIGGGDWAKDRIITDMMKAVSEGKSFLSEILGQPVPGSNLSNSYRG
jgi:hypothetical protein